MSYHLYTTEGIVLQGLPLKEADKYYYIFTKELGLVVASAKSVRKLESKLRFGLEDYSLGEFSFIRGREFWKITGVREKENIFRGYRESPEKRSLVVRVLNVAQKLVTGEEENIELFNLLIDSFSFLKSFQGGSEELRTFEYIVVLRMLSLLGYGRRGEVFSSFVETTAWSTLLLNDALPFIAQMREEIRTALEASQLS